MDRYRPQAVHAPAADPPPVLTSLDPPETNVTFPETSVQLGAEVDRRLDDDRLRMWDTAVCFRHSGWKHDRRRVYAALLATGQSANRRDDFTGCGQHAYVFQSVDNPDQYAIGGSTCHDRFCLPCGRERSRRIATNVLDKLEQEQARFLTLTLKSDGEPLAELLAKLSKDFASLRKTKLWRNKVTGGVAFTEIKWFAKTGRWHPHLHCLVQGRYLPQDELSKLWHKITGTSFIVDIRFATNNAIVTHYISKYATKPLDHSVVMVPDRLQEAVLALKGKRLCMTFGTWRGYSLTAPLEDGKWINLGTLRELVERATNGSEEAQRVLVALDVSYTQPARAPPVESLPADAPLTYAEPCFPPINTCGRYFETGSPIAIRTRRQRALAT